MTAISTRTDLSTQPRWTEERPQDRAPSAEVSPSSEPSPSTDEGTTSAHRGGGAGTASITRDATSTQLASRIAQQLEAKKGGGLTGEELSQIHAEARSQASDVATADAEMKKAITQNLPELTTDGAEWVQGGLGDMNGRVKDYQRVLGGLDKGAKYIDADWSGDISSGDVALKPRGDGRASGTSTVIDEATRDRVKLNAEIVNAAWDMSKADHAFSSIDRQTFNAKYWEKDPRGAGTFKLKPGVSASEAMKDVFENPLKYKFECATAMVLTFYQAAKKTMSTEKFNEMAKDLRVGPWEMEGDLARAFEQQGTALRDAEAGFREGLVPGEYAYIKNRDVSPSGLEAGWQGENVVALGDGKFYGHPFGVSTADEMIKHLNKHRNTGSTTSAEFLDLTGRLSTSLV